MMQAKSSVKLPQPQDTNKFTNELKNLLNDLLGQFIIEQKLIETPDRQAHRKDVLSDLEHKISQWVYDNYKNTHGQYMIGYKQNDSQSRLVLLQPYGSYLLQTNSPESDIDTVVIFPAYVKVETFFELFTIQLQSTKNVEKATHIRAKRPILNVTYRGIEVDLQPAVLTHNQVPRSIDWDNPQIFENIPHKYKEVIAAITTNIKIMQVVQEQYPLFQQLVRLVKYGNDQLLIMGNKIGYFGGINVSILCANLLWISNERLSLSQLLYAYYAYYSKYDFQRKPVILSDQINYQNQAVPMQIVTLTNPIINSTSKVTDSTRHVIVKHFKESKKSFDYLIKLIDACYKNDINKTLCKPAICQVIFGQLKQIEKPADQQPTIKQYSLENYKKHIFRDPDYKAGFLLIQIANPDEELLKAIQNKMEPQFVSIFKNLERLKLEIVGSNANISHIRPVPIWWEIPGKKSFFVGICVTNGEKEWLVKKLNDIIIQFKQQLARNMETEEIEMQRVIQQIIVTIKSGKEIQREQRAAEKELKQKAQQEKPE